MLLPLNFKSALSLQRSFGGKSSPARINSSHLVNPALLSGLLLCVITSAGREVKHSRCSGKSQSCFFCDKIRDAKSVGFWFYLAISDEVRTELVRDSSRSLRFL